MLVMMVVLIDVKTDNPVIMIVLSGVMVKVVDEGNNINNNNNYCYHNDANLHVNRRACVHLDY